MTYLNIGEGADLKFVSKFFDSICRAEGFGLIYTKGCDRIAALTPCKQKHSLNLSALHKLRKAVWGCDKGSDSEAGPGWFQGDNCRRAFLGTSDKTDWAANEDAVEIKFAVPYAADCS